MEISKSKSKSKSKFSLTCCRQFSFPIRLVIVVNMNNLFAILVVTFSLNFGLVLGQAVECFNVSACASTTIETTETVRCHGYFACPNSSISTTSHIRCHGSYGCYNGQNINYHGTDTNDGIECRGLFSCLNANNISSKGFLKCTGESSCSNSNITMNSIFDAELQCSGARSCQSTRVTTRSNNTIFGFYGSLSGANSVLKVDTGNNEQVLVNFFNFYGGYSGYNTTIICGNGSICYIDCKGNGCNELTAQCESDINDSCKIIPSCNSAEKSNMCPNGM